MLIPIVIPPAIQELYRTALQFWELHGLVTLAAFAAGGTLVFLLYSLLGFRRLRVVRRVLNVAEDTDLQEFEYGSMLNRIRVQRFHTSIRRHVQNLQAPAVRGTQIEGSGTLKRFDDSIVYYFPENSADAPEGLQLPENATWIFGNPPHTKLPLNVAPVIVDTIGIWYPAIVRSSSGLTQARQTARRYFWKHGYRNLYIGDFVLKGDVLGTITVKGLIDHHTVVAAPCDGFILQFGAYPFTRVVPGASVMLIGALPEVASYVYPHDLAGYFTCRPEGRATLVGTTIEPDTPIGNASLLFGSIQEPIYSTVRMRVVRQYVKNGDAVQYGQKLFAYIPLPETPLR